MLRMHRRLLQWGSSREASSMGEVVRVEKIPGMYKHCRQQGLVIQYAKLG